VVSKPPNSRITTSNNCTSESPVNVKLFATQSRATLNSNNQSSATVNSNNQSRATLNSNNQSRVTLNYNNQSRAALNSQSRATLNANNQSRAPGSQTNQSHAFKMKPYETLTINRTYSNQCDSSLSGKRCLKVNYLFLLIDYIINQQK